MEQTVERYVHPEEEGHEAVPLAEGAGEDDGTECKGLPVVTQECQAFVPQVAGKEFFLYGLQFSVITHRIGKGKSPAELEDHEVVLLGEQEEALVRVRAPLLSHGPVLADNRPVGLALDVQAVARPPGEVAARAVGPVEKGVLRLRHTEKGCAVPVEEHLCVQVLPDVTAPVERDAVLHEYSPAEECRMEHTFCPFRCTCGRFPDACPARRFVEHADAEAQLVYGGDGQDFVSPLQKVIVHPVVAVVEYDVLPPGVPEPEALAVADAAVLGGREECHADVRVRGDEVPDDGDGAVCARVVGDDQLEAAESLPPALAEALGEEALRVV